MLHKHCEHVKKKLGYTFIIQGHDVVEDRESHDENAKIYVCCKCKREYVSSWYYKDYEIVEGK